MVNFEVRQLSKNTPLLVYFVSTVFMIFVSVRAIHSWPGLWAQLSISLACILPVLMVLFKARKNLFKAKKWAVEMRFVFIIFILGLLNICFSEDRLVSFKGMSLFLMSGILVFCVSYALFASRLAQYGFVLLCSISFVLIIVIGYVEFIQQLYFHGGQILLFSSNPIPAGSLIILLSLGPLTLISQAKNNKEMFFLIVLLVLGIALMILIGQRGPILAMVVMFVLWAVICRKKLLITFLALFILAGIGIELRDANSLKKETFLVRMEFYHVALDVIKEKPVFGLGFNSSLERFIPFDYEPKIYPRDREHSFYEKVSGLLVFDNTILSLFCEAGGLFAISYLFFWLYLFKKTLLDDKATFETRFQFWLLLIVLVGFGVHSMSYDSLKYPHLNWIVHSLLGLIAHCHSSQRNNEFQNVELTGR